jgi:hypothetical protein
MESQLLGRYPNWMDSTSLQDLRDMGCLERMLRMSELYSPILLKFAYRIRKGGGCCRNDCSEIGQQ